MSLLRSVAADARAHARDALLESAEAKRLVVDQCLDDVVGAADLIADCFRAGGKLLICGNGGSAADAQHLAAEFVGRLTKQRERRALPALALTTDSSFLTAQANDRGFDTVFARQVEAFGEPGDLLLAITTSGGSPNVLRAAETASASRMPVVALMGQAGPLALLADVSVCVPVANSQRVQEAHVAIEHVLCDLVERALFDGETS